MTPLSRHRLCFVFASGLFAVAMAACGGPGKPSGTAEAKVDFSGEIKPLLQEHCVRCHNDQSLFGGLNLMNRALAFRGGNNGPVIVPGHPEQSRLYLVTLLPADQDHAMPATGAVLSDAEKEWLRLWIEQGATWPEGEEGVLSPVQATPGTV